MLIGNVNKMLMRLLFFGLDGGRGCDGKIAIVNIRICVCVNVNQYGNYVDIVYTLEMK